MKTLLFLRHGKSDWSADYDGDHERPLKKRGRKDAQRVGRLLAGAGPMPDFVLCSTAVRARKTLAHAAKGGAWPAVETRETGVLYEAEPEAVLAEIRQVPDAAGVLLLVGHDPAWSEAAGRLVGLDQLRLKTAALARIDVEVDAWRDVAFGGGTLVWLVPPKLLRAVED